MDEWTCPICDKTFESENTLESHVADHRKRGLYYYTCWCGGQCTCLKDFLRHMRENGGCLVHYFNFQMGTETK